MWLRLDDTLTDHPKFFGIDPRAGWLWILGLCYAGRHVLNGRLPRGTAFSLAAQVDRQQTVLDDDEPEMVRQLVSRGLWERAKDAYVIHDFLDYNPSRKEVLSERRAARLRSRKARQIRVSANVRSSEVRANVSRTSDPTPGTPVVRRSSTSPAVRFEGQGFQVLPERLEYWQGIYAAVDVASELRAAHAWLLANPARRPRNPERFLVGWLKRAQDQAATRPRRETFEERQQRYLKVLQGGSA